MRVIFFCGHKSPYGSVHLKPLLQSNFDIVAVVIATDKRWDIFRERLVGEDYYFGKDSAIKRLGWIIKTLIKKLIPGVIIEKLKKNYKDRDNIKKVLKKHKISLWFVDDVNTEGFIQDVKNMHVDLIISAAYPQIFSKRLISAPIRGAVNFHPSLLPKFRGAHPHYWAIVRGEKESGLTAHFMTEQIDDGDIIAQIDFPIQDYDYEQLCEKIALETPNLVRKAEDFFLKGKNSVVRQNSSKASYFRNDREIHHRIFWNIHTAKDIFNLVRGGNAFCFFRSQRIIVEVCFVSNKNRNLTNKIEVENGIIVDLGKNSIAVKASLGIVNITEVRYRYRKMEASKFTTKYNILVGERFD